MSKVFRGLFSLLAMILVITLLVSSSPRESAAGVPKDKPITGKQGLNAQQIANWFNAVPGRSAYRVSIPVEELAAIFLDEGAKENVRGDIAFMQSVKETGWFHFRDGGQVRPEDNNFAGIGACNSCNGGGKYPSIRHGVRAQIQHLKNYADGSATAASLAEPSMWPAFDSFWRQGQAPTWLQLNAKWAVPGTGYGERIIQMYVEAVYWNQGWKIPTRRDARGSFTSQAFS
jgi:hypothetical protein